MGASCIWDRRSPLFPFLATPPANHEFRKQEFPEREGKTLIYGTIFNAS
jgi:hypothetical protein